MPLNPVFEFNDQEIEQDILHDINGEAISIYGLNFYYMPRKVTVLNSVLGEDTQSYFDEAYEVEMYVKSVDGFKDHKDLMLPSGISMISDSATLQVARRVFTERLSGSGITKPRKGDLILIAMGHAKRDLFEVQYDEDESSFFQIGDLYVYDLTIQKFEYSNEKLRTGIPVIDDIENRYVVSAEITVATGAGNYAAKEFVYQGTDLDDATFSAEVISWVSPVLKVKHMKGALDASEDLIGDTSGCTRDVSSSTLSDDGEASTNDPSQDNEEFQELGEDLVEFDPSNPYGGK